MPRKKSKPTTIGIVTEVGWEPYADQSAHIYIKIRMDQCRLWNAEKEFEPKLKKLVKDFNGKEVAVFVQ